MLEPPQGEVKHRGHSLTHVQVEEIQTKILSKAECLKGQEEPTKKKDKHGMNFYVAAFFLIAQMAGAGFLALPKSISDCGWAGLVLLLAFCFLVGFSGTRLGHCWVMLEERWPMYSEPARQPYMEIAYRAYGRRGRIITLCAALTTMIGSCIVYIILMAQFLSSLIHQVSFCTTTIIVGLLLIIPTWAGTPSDFWQAAVLSVVAAFISFVVVLAELLIDKDTFPEPTYNIPTFVSFSLGFGTLLFSYGGASVFPTIQNDMEDRTQFWKSVMLAFSALIVMYFPVAVAGYSLLGSKVPSNILLYAGQDLSIPLKIAVIMEVVHLVVTFIISNNGVFQTFEEVFKIPVGFGWKRCVLRSTIVVIEIIVCLSFPDFGLILNLVGGSSITMCSFLFPPLYYMKLVNDSSLNKEWPQRTISTGEKTCLYIIVGVGLFGGISASGSAIMGIISTPFSSSCFSQLFS